MFDFARNAKLALADTARRTALKVGAGAVMAIGAGFLLAALWSYLAIQLDWGPTLASLAIGGGFIIIGVIVMMVASKKKHEMPSTDDLRNEVQARVDLAKDAAIERARTEATRFVDLAENRVHSLIDTAGYRASKIVSDAERSAYGFAMDAAQKVGLTSENIESVQDTAQEYAEKARYAANTNAGSMAKLIGAFAVGMAVASKIKGMRRDEYYGEYDDYDAYTDEDLGAYDPAYDDRLV